MMGLKIFVNAVRLMGNNDIVELPVSYIRAYMRLVNVCDCYVGSSVDDLSINVRPDPSGQTTETLRAGMGLIQDKCKKT